MAPAIVSKVNDDGTVGLTIFQPNVSNTFEPFVGEGYLDEHGQYANTFHPNMPNSSEPISAAFWNGKVDVGFWGWPELEPEVAPKVVPVPKPSLETTVYADGNSAKTVVQV